MTHESFGESLAHDLLTPQALAPAAVAMALWTLISVCSYRLLRARPDLPHQRELLWGARWSPLVLLIVVLAAFVVMYAGLTRTRFSLSSIIAGKALLEAGFLAFPVWLQHRLSGAGFSLIWLSARVRGKEPDVEAWLANVLGQGPRGRRWRRASRAVLVLLLSLDGYLLLGFTYPMDIDFARYAAARAVADSVASLVSAELRAPQVEKVGAYEPRGAYDLMPERAGDLATVRRSLRQILHGAPPVATPSSDWYVLFVRLRPGTRRSDAERILRETERLLAARAETHHWRIAVYVRDSDTEARGLYAPRAADGSQPTTGPAPEAGHSRGTATASRPRAKQ